MGTARVLAAALTALALAATGCARAAQPRLPWRGAVALRVGVLGWWNGATLADPALPAAIGSALAGPGECGGGPALGGFTLTPLQPGGRPAAGAVWEAGRLWWNGCAHPVPSATAWLIRGAVAAARQRWSGRLLPWTAVAAAFPVGSKAVLTDWATGRTLTVVRWGGVHHADVEPASAADAAALRAIYGGAWSWARRPVLVTLADGERVAASMNGMPHGGGSVGANAFSGHFCLHFLGSLVHRSGRLDPAHLFAILTAAGFQVGGAAGAAGAAAGGCG